MKLLMAGRTKASGNLTFPDYQNYSRRCPKGFIVLGDDDDERRECVTSNDEASDHNLVIIAMIFHRKDNLSDEGSPGWRKAPSLPLFGLPHTYRMAIFEIPQYNRVTPRGGRVYTAPTRWSKVHPPET